MVKYKAEIAIIDSLGCTRFIKDYVIAVSYFEACEILKAKYGISFQRFSSGPHTCES